MNIRVLLAAIATLSAPTIAASAADAAAPVSPFVSVIATPPVHVAPDRVAAVPLTLESCANTIACSAPFALYDAHGQRLTHSRSIGFLAGTAYGDFPGLRLTTDAWRRLHRRQRLDARVILTAAGRRYLLSFETLLLPTRGQGLWCTGTRRLVPPCHRHLVGRPPT